MPPVQFGPAALVDSARLVLNYIVTMATVAIAYVLGALVDRGANGGILGKDARPFWKYLRRINVTGIDNHKMRGIPVCDASAKILTNKGPAIGIFLGYAYSGKGRTIHSAGQFEAFGHKVDERSRKVGGKQCIITVQGYIIPIDIVKGLPYIPMERHTDEEWDELPHIIMTGPGIWKPSCLDNRLTQQENWEDLFAEYDHGIKIGRAHV